MCACFVTLNISVGISLCIVHHMCLMNKTLYCMSHLNTGTNFHRPYRSIPKWAIHHHQTLYIVRQETSKIHSVASISRWSHITPSFNPYVCFCSCINELTVRQMKVRRPVSASGQSTFPLAVLRSNHRCTMVNMNRVSHLQLSCVCIYY